MKNQKLLQVANIIGLIAVLIVNTLASTIPIGGRNTGEISDAFPNLFAPAGYAFSIWGLIYLLLIIYIIIQSKGLFSSSKSAPEFVDKIAWWFVISCIANSSWIFAWHHLNLGLSVMIMIILLGSLINIYTRLKVKYPKSEVPFMVRLPFSVYLGWITVATVANITIWLVSIEWGGFGVSEVYWTVLVLLVATGIGIAIFWERKDWGYIAVLIWAFLAIRAKRNNIGNPDEGIIIYTVFFAVGALLTVALVRTFLKKENNA